MDDATYAIRKHTSYENFEAECPYCGYWNIFNRASDLKDFVPIDFRRVYCLNGNCTKEFNINGDHVNAVYEMLVYDCHKLKQDKRYAYCILNLAQAYETFFSQYLRVELLFKPFARDGEDNLYQLNELAQQLYDYTKKYAFAQIRDIFLNRAVLCQKVNSLEDATLIIKQLKPQKKRPLPNAPSDIIIAELSDKHLSTLLRAVKHSKIAELRNQVVHKYAYRPKLEEVEDAIEETRKTLFPLGAHLDIHIDEINWYIEKFGHP